VKVRKNVAIGSHDKTRAFALDRTRRPGISAWIIFIGRPLKEQVVERRGLAEVVLLGNLNNDHARRDSFEDFGESVV